MKKYAIGLMFLSIVALMGFIIVSTTFEPLESLMRPPKVEGENLSIQLAFEENVGTDYLLKQPISGSYRSAYTFTDLTGDKEDEVIVFYSKADELGIVRMNVLDKVDGNWKSIADFQSVHNDIQEIAFADLNGYGYKEIIVGWTALLDSYSKLLTVYKISMSAEVNIEPFYSDYYSMFKVTDIDCDGKEDILSLKYVTAGNSAEYTAYLLTYSENEIRERGAFVIDKSVSSLAAVSFDFLQEENISRIYVDGYKVDSGMTTDCFSWNTDESKFSRHFVDGISVSALSSRTSGVLCSDINSDGIIEIPTEEFLPNISEVNIVADTAKNNNPGHSLINWVNIDGDSAETVERHIILSQYGYSFNFSEKWLGRISVENNPQKGILSFYSLKDSGEGKLIKDKILFSVMTLTDLDLEAIGELSFHYSQLTQVKEKYYFCRIYDSAEDFDITKKEIKQRFIAG